MRKQVVMELNHLEAKPLKRKTVGVIHIIKQLSSAHELLLNTRILEHPKIDGLPLFKHKLLAEFSGFPMMFCLVPFHH